MTNLSVLSEREGSITTHKLSGTLTRETLPSLNKVSSGDGGEGRVHLDLKEVRTFDSFGVVGLLEIAALYEGRVSFFNTSPELKAYMLKVPVSALFQEEPEKPASMLASLGEWLIRAGTGTRQFISLGFEFIYWVGIAPFRGRKIYIGRTIHEFYLAGVEAIPIVGLISLLMGVIIALNASYQLSKFGAKIFVANMVAVTLTRELGPVITAMVVAGRTGSAIAAELGTMIVTEELEALRVTGIHPTSFLIVPKLLALVLAVPCLTIFCIVVGIGGGMGISVTALDLGLVHYFEQTRSSLEIHDLVNGMSKSIVFGLVIGLTGATLGLRLKGGAEEVGRITTAAVVMSFFLLIFTDLVFTLLSTLVEV